MDDLAQIYKEVAPKPVSLTVDGVTSYIAAEDGKIVTGTVQDCTPILEHAHALREAQLFGSNEMRHVASFPAAVVETYCNQCGIDFREFLTNPVHVKRMASDPDLAGFRIWTGSTNRVFVQPALPHVPQPAPLLHMSDDGVYAVQ